MVTLAIVAGVVLGLGAVFWAASRLGEQVGRTDEQLDNARDSIRRAANALEADARVRRDIAAAGVYAPDENQRD